MRYKSEIYEVIHRDAVANFDVGAISAAEMREFDEMCLADRYDAAVTSEFFGAVAEPAAEYITA